MNNLIPHIKTLGFGGLIPFVLLLATLLMFDDEGQIHFFAERLLVNYTVIIITFVGALNWGLGLSFEAFSEGQRKTLLTYSVLPSLLVWLFLLLPSSSFFIASALLYLVCYGIDSRLTLIHLPNEYAQMRRKLSFSVAGVLLMASQLV